MADLFIMPASGSCIGTSNLSPVRQSDKVLELKPIHDLLGRYKKTAQVGLVHELHTKKYASELDKILAHMQPPPPLTTFSDVYLCGSPAWAYSNSDLSCLGELLGLSVALSGHTKKTDCKNH
jgi:hypothetical protein